MTGFSDSCRTSGPCACGSGEYRPYVENYTVDASIFLVENITTFVVVCSIEENNVRHRIMTRYGPSGSSGSDVGGNHWSSPLQEVPSGIECGGCDSYSCMWSSLKEQTVDALATGAEEGRSNLR